MAGRPRKLTPEMVDWLELEFFYTRNNSEIDLQTKIKKKFKVRASVEAIKKVVSSFFYKNGKVKITKNLENERNRRKSKRIES